MSATAAVYSFAVASQFATIGGLALVFSGVGLYSAMAYAVRRRTQEIAVRMALSAQATEVGWLFLETGARVILAGSPAMNSTRQVVQRAWPPQACAPTVATM